MDLIYFLISLLIMTGVGVMFYCVFAGCKVPEHEERWDAYEINMFVTEKKFKKLKVFCKKNSIMFEQRKLLPAFYGKKYLVLPKVRYKRGEEYCPCMTRFYLFV